MLPVAAHCQPAFRKEATPEPMGNPPVVEMGNTLDEKASLTSACRTNRVNIR